MSDYLKNLETNLIQSVEAVVDELRNDIIDQAVEKFRSDLIARMPETSVVVNSIMDSANVGIDVTVRMKVQQHLTQKVRSSRGRA